MTTPVGRLIARSHRASGRESRMMASTPTAKTSPIGPLRGILCIAIPGCTTVPLKHNFHVRACSHLPESGFWEVITV